MDPKSAFRPTLKIVITLNEVAALIASGTTVEEAQAEISDFYTSEKINGSMYFYAERVVVIDEGLILDGFKALVVAVFEISGTVHLKLATGDIVDMVFYYE